MNESYDAAVADAPEAGLSKPQPPLFDRAALPAALTALGIYLAFDLLLPVLPVHPIRLRGLEWALANLTLLLLIPTSVFMWLQVWLSRRLVAVKPAPRVALIVAAVCILLWFATIYLLHGSRQFSHSVNREIAYIILPTLLGTLLTVGLTALGVLLARIVRERNVLLPVAFVAMPIDYVGAMTNVGFTHHVVTQSPGVVSAVSVHVPSLGGLHPLALVGPGDALFMAFFFAVVQNFDMNVRGTFRWMTVLLAITICYVILPDAIPIAALVPMGIAVIVANWHYFSLKRDEKFAMLYAALLVFIVIGGFYLFTHRFLFNGNKAG